MLEQGKLLKKHNLTSSGEFKKAIAQAKSTDTSKKQEGTALNPVLMGAVAGQSFPKIYCT
jgi:hypothetical protein